MRTSLPALALTLQGGEMVLKLVPVARSQVTRSRSFWRSSFQSMTLTCRLGLRNQNVDVCLTDLWRQIWELKLWFVNGDEPDRVRLRSV